MLFKFLKFALVGTLGLLIDFSTTYWLKERLSINRYLANSIGFTLAASCNYYLNRIWTFESTNPNIPIEYSSFLLVSIVGLIINNGILYLLHNRFKVNFYISKAGAIAVTVIWNFLANYFFTFNL